MKLRNAAEGSLIVRDAATELKRLGDLGLENKADAFAKGIGALERDIGVANLSTVGMGKVMTVLDKAMTDAGITGDQDRATTLNWVKARRSATAEQQKGCR